MNEADSLFVIVSSTVSLIDLLLERSSDSPTLDASLFTVIDPASILSALKYPVIIASAVKPSPVPNQMFALYGSQPCAVMQQISNANVQLCSAFRYNTCLLNQKTHLFGDKLRKQSHI